MSNPKLEIGVCVNTIKEQTHMLMLICHIQREFRKSNLMKLDKYPQDPDAMTKLAKQTLAQYKHIINKK